MSEKLSRKEDKSRDDVTLAYSEITGVQLQDKIYR